MRRAERRDGFRWPLRGRATFWLAATHEEGGGEEGGEETALVERALRVFLADDVLPGEGVGGAGAGAAFGRDRWVLVGCGKESTIG